MCSSKSKMWSPISLLILLLALSGLAQQVRYVKPKDSSPLSCPGQPCFTLDQYREQPTVYFATGSTFVFLAGNHSLDFAVGLANVSNVTFLGKSGANFICGDGVSVLFENVTDMSITGMRFLFNSSYSTPVFVFYNSTNILITSTAFQDLRRRSRAVYSINSSITVRYCLFEGSTGRNGGAMLSYHSIISLYQSRFERNEGNKGGAISAFDSILQLAGNSFHGNKAKYGAAIYAVKSTINLTNSTFVANNAKFRGGALLSFQSEVFLSRCLFRRNEVEQGGGAISAALSNVSITYNAFYNNSAKIRGGAIDLDRSGIKLTNNSFVRNIALERGGAVYANESILDLLGNSFTSDVSTSGSAIFANNSVLYRNETFRNVFEHNRGGIGGPIACINCAITMTGKNYSTSTSKAYLATVGGLLPTLSIVAMYSNSRAPGDAFVGIIASLRWTKIILSGNSTLGGEQYMLYSIENPEVLSFYNGRRPTSISGGRSGFLSFGKTMKSDFNFYTNLATAINSVCSDCNLKLMGIAYFPNSDIMPAYSTMH